MDGHLDKQVACSKPMSQVAQWRVRKKVLSSTCHYILSIIVVNIFRREVTKLNAKFHQNPRQQLLSSTYVPQVISQPLPLPTAIMATDDLFVDDFWYDDDGFVGYVENTIDPGKIVIAGFLTKL